MIQIDMSMPTTCFDCPACNEYLDCAIPVSGREWGENDVSEFSQGRPEWCPMKEQEAVELVKWIYPTDVIGFGRCPHCNSLWDYSLISNRFFKHCPRCGKAVKWNER